VNNDGRRLREDRKEPQPHHREAEEFEADAFHKGREAADRHKSPVKMPRIAEKLEFIAVKAVAAIGEQVNERHRGGDGQQEQGFGLGAAVQSIRVLVHFDCRHRNPASFRSSLGELRAPRRSGSSAPFVGLWNPDGSHAGSRCRLNAQVRVFKDQAIFRRHAKPGGGKQKRIRSRLAVDVILRADDGLEFVQQMQCAESLRHRDSPAAGNHGKGNPAVLGLDDAPSLQGSP
jgi:hypothetical protein